MNMIPIWRKSTPQTTFTLPPLDLDPDFEEACARSLQEPMQTPVERLREATENIVTVLRDEDRAHDDRIAEYRLKLAAEEMAKEANLLEIAKAERALAELACDAASPSPKPDKPKKSCRRTSISETAGRAGEKTNA